jgi:hypothetical protein
MPTNTPTRRGFLQSTLAGAARLAGAAWLANPLSALARERPTLPVAGVATVYRKNSHADVILGKILEGYDQKGGPGPDLKLASLYLDQTPPNDLGRELAKKHGVYLASTIEEAITLGRGEVAVRGVLNIGEHGDYPETPDTRQRMYPRRRLFDGVAAALRRYREPVPLFNDKHLAYNWADAKHMYDTARELAIPFMAGSSLPVAWREPPLELPRNCQIEQAMVVGYGGLESYGFHALETLQCMVERRKGGETGVAAVRAVKGEAIWEAERQGLWSRELFHAALATMPGVRQGKPEELLRDNAAFYLINYRDGLRATVTMANGIAQQFAFAARLRGESKPVATWFKLQDEAPFGHFGHLLHAIEHMVHTGKPAWPVERTLLTTGILDEALHSLTADQARRETPHLAVSYTAANWPFATTDIPEA